MARLSNRVKLTLALHGLLTLAGTIACSVGFAQEVWALHELGALDRPTTAPVAPFPVAASAPTTPTPSLAAAPTPAPPSRPLPPPEIHAWAAALEAAGYVVDPAQIHEPGPYSHADLVATRLGHRYSVTLLSYSATPVVEGRRRTLGRVSAGCGVVTNFWGDADPAIATATLVDALLAQCPASPEALGTVVRGVGYPITEEPSGDSYDDNISTSSVRCEHDGEISLSVETWSQLVAPRGTGAAHRSGDDVVLVTTYASDPDPAGTEALASLLVAPH